MVRLGLPVPPGFVVSTPSCMEYIEHETLGGDLTMEIRKAVEAVERETGRNFFSVSTPGPVFPLLLSARSGAPVSMPGMMSTVLNIGLNDQRTEQLAHVTNNRRFALDCYRRFLQMFGNVVLGIDSEKYEDIISEVKKQQGAEFDHQLVVQDLEEIVRRFKAVVMVPDDPWIQLEMAVEAVFRSWNAPRAKKYRDIHNINDEVGTAVSVQAMVYGNVNTRSGSGVVFTRNPSTGNKEIYGEYLWLAEGEDVVSGIRNPEKIEYLQLHLPSAYDSLIKCLEILENHYRDVQVGMIVVVDFYFYIFL
jgi:pyruvate, orthophosphate dikinase